MRSTHASSLLRGSQAPACTVKGSCVAFVVCALFSSTAVAQQETLGSILDKGATKMPAAELSAGLKSGKLPDAGQFEGIAYEADGRISGRYQNYSVSGEWTVDPKGLLCGEWYTNFGNTWKVCRYWFKLGDVYYVVESESDSDRTLLVQKAKPN